VILERQDRRLIAAIQCVDAVVGESIVEPLHIGGRGIHIVRNRLGLYVLTAAPGFADYTRQFDPADLVTPAVDSLDLLISDLRGQYLPRRYRLMVPRALSATAETSIFRPVVVPLFPAPAFARPQPGWAVVRASLTDAGGRPLPWALIEVSRPADPAIATLAQADGRGEAMIAVPEIPVTLWSAEDDPADDAEPPPILLDAIAVTATAIVAPALAGNPPDPDDVLVRRATLPQGTLSLSIAAARSQTLSLAFALSLP
jgi:hypothetical protein